MQLPIRGDLDCGGVADHAELDEAGIPADNGRAAKCGFQGRRIVKPGREGLRWAIEDMTEIRIMVLAQPG